MDLRFSPQLVPLLVDGLVIAGFLLTASLGRIQPRWRLVAGAFVGIMAVRMLAGLLHVLGLDGHAIPLLDVLFTVGLALVVVLLWREILRPQRILERAAKRRAEFEGSVDAAPAIIVNLTQDGVILHANRYAAHFLRDMAGPLAGRDFYKSCIAEAHREPTREYVYSFVASGGQTASSFECWVNTLDGPKFVDWRLAAQYDDEGTVVGVMLYGEDITDRREAEAILDRYRILTEDARDIIMFVRHSDGRVIEANRAAEVAYGYRREDLLRLTVADLRAPETLSLLPQQLSDAAAEGVLFETVHQRSDGSLFPVEVSSQATRSIENETVLLSIIRDITERKQTAAEIEVNRRRLKELAREITVNEERQRRLFAIEMHDRVSQPLAAAKLKLEVGLHKSALDPETLEFKDSVGLLGEAISESRSITREMSPPLLYDVGLGPALEWLAGQQSKYGLECTAHCEQLADLDNDLRAFIFRTARELLMNVTKHSGVDRAELELYSERDSVVLVVSDEGSGFDTQRLSALPDESSGFGLFSIQEYTAALGAEMTIESAPGQGTTIRVEVPAEL